MNIINHIFGLKYALYVFIIITTLYIIRNHNFILNFFLMILLFESQNIYEFWNNILKKTSHKINILMLKNLLFVHLLLLHFFINSQCGKTCRLFIYYFFINSQCGKTYCLFIYRYYNIHVYDSTIMLIFVGKISLVFNLHSTYILHLTCICETKLENK